MPEGVDVGIAAAITVPHFSQQKGQDFIWSDLPILQTVSSSVLAHVITVV